MEAQSPADAAALLETCHWPSEAYWRMIELDAVRPYLVDLQHPVLELGCGTGLFTELAGLQVDLAVDLNPNAVARARERPDVYRSVREVDIRALDPKIGTFGTIFSNSVLEHVTELESVLARCCELLSPAGRLIATVPLRAMNDHLTVRSPAYARARQRMLQHHNLWTIEEWESSLEAAGFAAVSASPYLDGAACHRWDMMDAPAAVGIGRYRVAPIVDGVLSRMLPAALKQRGKSRLARSLLAWTARPSAGSFCASVLIAAKGGGGQ